ncbi:Bifunctional coenzyme A synthase [Chionoecetes opilio]|uniref:Bifunctional coenzyme A synthase n=1 Tax=Chionoecetes opilio TaxID=41210 RepID=A0A8J4XVC5_CHIOP|nr:Bifunctional coenzyme A synthase [Chionoecetes opilio]
MVHECIACDRPVRARQQGIQCDGCDRWQHRTCGTGLTQADYRRAVQNAQSTDHHLHNKLEQCCRARVRASAGARRCLQVLVRSRVSRDVNKTSQGGLVHRSGRAALLCSLPPCLGAVMCAVTGLLVLTQPAGTIVASLPWVLRAASQHVTRMLYVHLDPLARTSLPPRPLTLYSHIITTIYARSPALCAGLEVRVLLAGFKACAATPPHTRQPVDVVLLAGAGQGGERLQEAVRRYSGCPAGGGEVVVLPEAQEGQGQEDGPASLPPGVPTDQVYRNVVLGGTFDRPHAGHLVLVSAALLRCRDRLVCGVADGPLLRRKTLAELIRPVQERLAGVTQLVGELDPSVRCEAVAIQEALGPTRWDPDMQMLVVSEETKGGVAAINRVREESGLCLLEGHVVSLVEDEGRESPEEETKASSSSVRMRLLGTFLRQPAPAGPARPYVIGLTGGSATGKSTLARQLAGLGAAVVDCDKLGHEAYLPGTACNKALVESFGSDIVGEDGHINRPALAARVFGSEAARQQLNGIVWPEIERLVRQRVARLAAQGTAVVVVDAALLLEAQWDTLCHQVWVCVLRREEAIRRITQRDNKSREQAERRLDSQMAPGEQVARANVVFCTEWADECTRRQVERAWDALTNHLSHNTPTPNNTTTTNKL